MKTAASELLRALRGSETQAAFSRRLGYRSNVAAEWEGGRRSPNALELVRIGQIIDVDVLAALRGLSPEHASRVRPDDLGPWLDALRGTVPQTVLARRIGCSRHQVRRWITGTAVPRIPDLLSLIDGLTHRPATFVSALVDPSEVPSLHARLAHEQARAAFLSHPRVEPLRRAQIEAGLHPDAVVVVPLGSQGLAAVRGLHRELVRQVRRAAVPTGEPDAVAVLTLGTGVLPVR